MHAVVKASRRKKGKIGVLSRVASFVLYIPSRPRCAGARVSPSANHVAGGLHNYLKGTGQEWKYT